MTDDEALYRAILAYPDDNLPRLAFADWLDENGPSAAVPWSAVEPSGLAAFIRTHIELDPLPDYSPRWATCRYRDEANVLGTRWLHDLPALPNGLEWASHRNGAREGSIFRRGFPACVKAEDGRVFVENVGPLLALAPIESVAFQAIRHQEAGPLAECEALSHLVRLEFLQGLSSHAARRLFESPYLARCTQLYLGPEMTVIETARAVVRSPLFGRLTTLSCRDDRWAGGSLVEELTQLARPPALKQLFLAGNRINAERAALLFAAPAVSAVESLDLSENNLGAEGVAVVAAAHLPRLRSLALVRTWPRTSGVESLAQSALAVELRSLVLDEDALEASAAEALAGGRFTNLQVLHLAGNRIGDRGAQVLAGSPTLRGMLVLDLARNQIEDAGALALVESPYLEGLVHLNLEGNVISRMAGAKLAQRFGERVVL